MQTLWLRSRPILAALAVLGLGACAGNGCSCITPIKGGFPVARRHENAIQVRATAGMFKYISDNGATVIPALIGSNKFTVPPGCDSDTKICCAMPNQVCELSFDFQRLALTPTAPNLLKLDTDVVVKTVQALPVTLLGANCLITIDTTLGSPQSLNVKADIGFTVDAKTKTTALSASAASVDIKPEQIKIGGGGLCAVVDFPLIIKPIVVGIINGQIASQLGSIVSGQGCEKCTTRDDCSSFAMDCKGGTCYQDADGKVCVPSLGVAGKIDVGSALASTSPGLQATMDLLAVTGGYASADSGLSLGLLAGAQGDPHSSCVPVTTPPTIETIAQSPSFAKDTLPDGSGGFHLGIGIHRSTLDTLAWGAFDSGTLCLHIGTPQVAQLSGKTLGIVLQSLQDLVHTSNASMFIALKPTAAPTFQIGKGTFTTDSAGTKVVDDPLLTVTLPRLSIDFFAFADDRYVRIMTLTADLVLPLGLTIDGNGALVPLFGDLTEGFQNVSVSNSELLAETPGQLASVFPMVLGVAVSKIAENLKISLPALAGLKLTPLSVTSTDPDMNGVNQFMGIFANVSVATPLRPFRSGAPLEARLLRMELPPTREFAVSGRGSARPTAVVRVDGNSDLEYTWALDGGVWHQFVAGPELAIADPQMWLQGRHFVDIRARRVGGAQMLAGEPARVDFLVDTIAPSGGFDVAGGELRVDVEDNVSPAELVSFRFAAGGGSFGAWTAGARTTLPAGIDPATLRVEAQDEAGNIGALGFHGRSTTPTGKGCGCDLGAHDDGGTTLPAILAIGALALLLTRRRTAALRRAALPALATLALLAAAGACNHSSGQTPLGKGDLANPDGEIGRFHDVAVDRNNALHLSAYDDSMGDLVYTRLENPDAPPAWQVIDGVDLTATPETMDGYRHGITEPGPDVGLYTSIAVNSHNDPRIAYYDASAGALKYAIGPHPFTTITVDAPAGGVTKAGQHTALSLDKEDHPAIAYVVTNIQSNNGFKSELRVATAGKDKPGADDWTITTIDSTPITCAGLCDASSACVVASMINGMPNSDPLYSSCVRIDAAACAATCSATQACIQGVCAEVLARPGAPALVEGIGLFVNARRNGAGKLMLVYYDHTQGDLKLATQNDDGSYALSFLDGQNAATDVGQFASARIDGDDSIHVAYVDAFTDQLLYKHIAGGTVPAMADVIDDGVRGDGAHSVGAGANLILDGNGQPRVVYQDQTTADLQLATHPSTWSHAPASSGSAGFGFYPHQVLVKSKVWVTDFVYDRANSGGAAFGGLRVSAP